MLIPHTTRLKKGSEVKWTTIESEELSKKAQKWTKNHILSYSTKLPKYAIM
jgi:hypothetical protein